MPSAVLGGAYKRVKYPTIRCLPGGVMACIAGINVVDPRGISAAGTSSGSQGSPNGPRSSDRLSYFFAGLRYQIAALRTVANPHHNA